MRKGGRYGGGGNAAVRSGRRGERGAAHRPGGAGERPDILSEEGSGAVQELL